MKPLAIALLVVLTASSYAGDAPDAVAKDLAKLQGEWAMVSGVADGMPMPEALLPTAKRTCKGDEVTVVVAGQVIMRAKVTIDPSKTPAAIDYDVLEGPTKGKKHLGVYAFEGGQFKSCFAAPDGERPGDFTSKEGDRRTASVWKRAEAPPKPPEK
jgi:uncharacterized protein (TIGR03067 family)